MIYRLAQDILANLQARKWPVELVYGDVSANFVAPQSMLMVVCRDSQSGDLVASSTGWNANPRRTMLRALAVKIVLFAASPLNGALLHDHERDCDALVDALVSALDAWATAAKAGTVQYTETRYLRPDEWTGASAAAGVAYVLRFRVMRAVTDRDYEGAARDTVPAPGAIIESRVSRDGENWESI